MRRFSAALSLLILLQSTTSAWAWGRLGHRVIANLAERHLTDRSRAEIKALLEPGESLADCSTWADEVRGRMRETAPWHYVDVPLEEDRYDDKWASEKGGYLIPKIRELRVTLKDRSRPLEERRQALRFLVHFIEDLHMPMHVGENHDQGGNRLQVRFFDRGSNLHSVWDTGIISRAQPNEDRWVADLIAMDTPEALAAAQEGSVEDWATESLLASREAYVDPATGQRMKLGAKLGDEYQAKSLPVAKRRFYQAGARLAWVLNEAFAEERCSQEEAPVLPTIRLRRVCHCVAPRIRFRIWDERGDPVDAVPSLLRRVAARQTGRSSMWHRDPLRARKSRVRRDSSVSVERLEDKAAPSGGFAAVDDNPDARADCEPEAYRRIGVVTEVKKGQLQNPAQWHRVAAAIARFLNSPGLFAYLQSPGPRNEMVGQLEVQLRGAGYPPNPTDPRLFFLRDLSDVGPTITSYSLVAQLDYLRGRNEQIDYPMQVFISGPVYAKNLYIHIQILSDKIPPGSVPLPTD